jgi:alpha-L-fucosidase
MFIHFGMSTFEGVEQASGCRPSTLYAPDRLDVDQWVSVARDAGMTYAVLTAKHSGGHCLWPSRKTDYHVGTSGNKTDVVEAFVASCRKRGVLPGLYYCSWDNHHKFGSFTATDHINMMGGTLAQSDALREAFTTRAYRDFQTAQLEELLTQYGEIAEVWIDIPLVLPCDYRSELYGQIAAWQPNTVIMMNHGFGDGSKFVANHAWPTDLIAAERSLPSESGHQPWREIEGKPYYLPCEVCIPIGREWFYVAGDRPRDDAELLGMYWVTRARGANLLLDVGPDTHGRIPRHSRDALRRLRSNLDRNADRVRMP